MAKLSPKLIREIRIAAKDGLAQPDFSKLDEETRQEAMTLWAAEIALSVEVREAREKK